jgi:hypothetical protein
VKLKKDDIGKYKGSCDHAVEVADATDAVRAGPKVGDVEGRQLNSRSLELRLQQPLAQPERLFDSFPRLAFRFREHPSFWLVES